MIGKISELLVGVNRSTAAPFFDVLMTSPKSPLDFKILPQISQRNSSKRFYDDNLGGSVGLGIVAALENSNTRRITSVCRSEPNQPGRSDPVQFMSHGGSTDGEDEEMFIMDEEDYTLVTCHHGPSGSCNTRVYDKMGLSVSQVRSTMIVGKDFSWSMSLRNLQRIRQSFRVWVSSIHVTCAGRNFMVKTYLFTEEKKHFAAQSVDRVI